MTATEQTQRAGETETETAAPSERGRWLTADGDMADDDMADDAAD